MRKPKGKLVALLAGAVAVPLLTLAVLFWKDVYCHLFLDPRLVGKWKLEGGEQYLAFDRLGNVVSENKAKGTVIVNSTPRLRGETLGIYSIDGNSLTIDVWGEDTYQYQIELNSLRLRYETLRGHYLPAATFRRVPDELVRGWWQRPTSPGLKCHLSPRPLIPAS